MGKLGNGGPEEEVMRCAYVGGDGGPIICSGLIFWRWGDLAAMVLLSVGNLCGGSRGYYCRYDRY